MTPLRPSITQYATPPMATTFSSPSPPFTRAATENSFWAPVAGFSLSGFSSSFSGVN